MTPLETITNNGLIGKIFQDEDPENPRELDNLATLVCFHRRYTLGDRHSYRHEDYSGWGDFEASLRKADPSAVILPLHLYDHSGITISTRPFSCPWDSGQIGFVMVPSSKIREEYGVKRITRKIRERAEGVARGEVETYDSYLRGDVYGYTLEKEGEEDSCWGFFGMDAVREELQAAMGIAA